MTTNRQIVRDGHSPQGARVRKVVARNRTRGTLLAADIESADGLWAKFMGLMGRRSLSPGSALWLPDSNGIHMMFMRFPIDCLFLGRPGRDGLRPIVGLRQALRPWTGIVWFVRGADGVLELPAGTIASSGAELGDQIQLEPAS